MGGERGGKDGFGFGGALVFDEQVGERGGGLRVVGLLEQQAAVGCLGGGCAVAGRGGELGGEESVFGGFGRELERGEQLVAGVGGAGALVDAGEGAVGASFEQGIAGGQGCGGGELGAGFGKFVGAGEEEAQGYAGLEEGGVVGGCGAVAGFAAAVWAGSSAARASCVEPRS